MATMISQGGGGGEYKKIECSLEDTELAVFNDHMLHYNSSNTVFVYDDSNKIIKYSNGNSLQIPFVKPIDLVNGTDYSNGTESWGKIYALNGDNTSSYQWTFTAHNITKQWTVDKSGFYYGLHFFVKGIGNPCMITASCIDDSNYTITKINYAARYKVYKNNIIIKQKTIGAYNGTFNTSTISHVLRSGASGPGDSSYLDENSALFANSLVDTGSGLTMTTINATPCIYLEKGDVFRTELTCPGRLKSITLKKNSSRYDANNIQISGYYSGIGLAYAYRLVEK